MKWLTPLWNLLKATTLEWWNDNTFRLAGSLAFYTIFSLTPLLVIAVAIVGFFFNGREQAIQSIVEQVQGLVGKQGGMAVKQVAEAGAGIGNSPLALCLGVGTLLVGSTVVFAELQAALNQIWDVKADPNRSVIKMVIRARARSFVIALGVGFLLLVSLLLSAGLAILEKFFAHEMPGIPWWLWRGGSMIVGFAVITLLFAMIYKLLPDVKISWKDVGIGAAVTAVLFSAGKYAIGFYLGHAAIGSAYGAAGSFVVLLIWIYYSALISFYGAEFTQVYARTYGSRIRPETYAVRIGNKSNHIQTPEEEENRARATEEEHA